MRLDKYLADADIGTRSEVKILIKKGTIKVNQEVVKDPGLQVVSGDVVLFMDEVVEEPGKVRVYMLNKPAGVISATKDDEDRTVLDLLKGENVKNLFPVGRLDKDTEGLLLITNDGALSHKLLSPKKHVDKTYLVITDKEISENDMQEMENGIDIGDDKKTLPCKLQSVYPRDENVEANNKKFDGADNELITDHLEEIIARSYVITIHEGRYHQVKRMFSHFGANVVYLKRIAFGPLVLDDGLAPGAFRKLTDEEMEMLNAAIIK